MQVRFFFKVDTHSKAKVLRKVSFALELDAYDYCSPELKKTLDGPRAALKDAQVGCRDICPDGPYQMGHGEAW